MTTATDYAALTDRELDALVAERVMGLVPCQSPKHGPLHPGANCHAFPDSPTQGGEDPRYSYSLEEMASVAVKVKRFGITITGFKGDVDAWVVDIGGVADPVMHKELPRALCIAALRALDAEVAA